MRQPSFHRAAICAALLSVTSAGWAATATTTFGVTAQVVPTCTVSATTLAFGSSIPSPITTNIDAQGAVNATCSTNAAYTVALNRGAGAGATFAARRMTNGANGINYALYRNATRTQLWGDGTAGSSVANATGSGASQALVVYGRIAGGQAAPTGSYSDTITVTVTF
jgi:spore coat protein U-like protein